MDTTRSTLTYLALGSNIGDAKMHFNTAVAELKTKGNVIAKSKLYRCKAACDNKQADYWNAAILFETSLSPHELLKLTQDIETACGRTSKNDQSPRTLDIDLISYDDLIINDPELILPHPRAHERDFVLLPLIEINTSWKHPVSGKTAQELIDTLKETSFLGETEEL